MRVRICPGQGGGRTKYAIWCHGSDPTFHSDSICSTRIMFHGKIFLTKNSG